MLYSALGRTVLYFFPRLCRFNFDIFCSRKHKRIRDPDPKILRLKCVHAHVDKSRSQNCHNNFCHNTLTSGTSNFYFCGTTTFDYFQHCGSHRWRWRACVMMAARWLIIKRSVQIVLSSSLSNWAGKFSKRQDFLISYFFYSMIRTGIMYSRCT